MDELHKKIISKASYKQYPKNTILLKEGELSNTFVFLKKGVVRHFFTDRNGNDITKNFITESAFFVYSLSSFITQTPSAIQCEPLTDAELYEIAREDLMELLDEKEFASFWNGMLSNYILKKEKKEMSLMKDKASKRYEMFLKEYPGLLNQIPHYYIASYLSVSPETLSRIRKGIS